MGEINAEFKKLTDLLEKTRFKEWVLSGNMDKLSDEVRHQIGVIANKLETMAPIDLAHVVHNKTIRSWCKLFPVTNFYTKIPKRAMQCEFTANHWKGNVSPKQFHEQQKMIFNLLYGKDVK